MSFTYKQVKEYNDNNISDGVDLISTKSHLIEPDDRDKYIPMWDYCLEIIQNNLDVLRDTEYSRMLWCLHDDGCSGEHYTTIFCKQHEWFSSLSIEDQFTVGMLGFRV